MAIRAPDGANKEGKEKRRRGQDGTEKKSEEQE